jgi:tetratricopeptide (TPR) repeat protein
MNNLANVYWSHGDYAQAEALYSETMEIQRRVLGPEHPDTLLSMGNLAGAYTEDGKYAQAEALFSQTLEISRHVLGPEHTNTLGFLLDYASLCQRQGKYALAEKYAAQVLSGRRRMKSEDPSEIQTAAADLALAYVSQRKFTESEPLARWTLRFSEKNQPERWERFRAESLLGASLAGEKRYAEAEPLLLSGYQGMLARKGQMWAANLRHLDSAHEWLVQLYEAWGKPDKAAEWKKH